MKHKFTVAVLAGGIGEERPISIESGKSVTDALTDARINAICADITPENMYVLDNPDIDLFFLALHGRFGEDGQLQQILEDRNLPYTGSGPQASRLAFDKMLSKRLFAQAGVNTAPAVVYTPQSDIESLEKQLLPMGKKFVVKPLRQGSSVGVRIVEGAGLAVAAAKLCCSDFGDCMIEQFIPGRELTVGVLGDKVLPIIEIRPKQNFYDYHAKYLDDSTEYQFDTITDRSLVEKINAAALSCFKALGCRHFARADLIVTDQGIPFALEVNTIPGFTTHSCLPKAAVHLGLSMSRLCAKIVEMARQDKNRRCAAAGPSAKIRN